MNTLKCVLKSSYFVYVEVGIKHENRKFLYEG